MAALRSTAFGLISLCLGLLGSPATAAGRDAPAIAIVIDDLGYNWALSRQVMDLPVEVTASILPGTPYARRLALLAHEQGRQSIVHLPMESVEPQPLGPNALLASMDPVGISTLVADALQGVPHAIGLSNHMGSRATADAVLMTGLMQALANYPGLLFVDSRTSPDSVAMATARQFGLPAVQRDIFLDHEHQLDEVGHQFERLLQRARITGHALGIGHPVPETLAVLEDLAQRLEIEGIRLLALTDFMALRARLAPDDGGGRIAAGAEDLLQRWQAGQK